ncbi:MAG: nuclease, partial [Steroidobacteraceae bacterium]|nr:nuclease [Steroidobacteraceae bacterium]
GKCTIKGNLGPGGTKIYHVPGSHSYEATRIDPATGERWFCSEDDARRAGWRAPR